MRILLLHHCCRKGGKFKPMRPGADPGIWKGGGGGHMSRRDSIPYAALYIAPILIDTRLHSTRGQFFIRLECGACIRLRTNTLLLRMISRSAYGFSIFDITCLHISDERVQTLHTSCIGITSSVLYTRS